MRLRNPPLRSPARNEAGAGSENISQGNPMAKMAKEGERSKCGGDTRAESENATRFRK